MFYLYLGALSIAWSFAGCWPMRQMRYLPE